MTNGGELGALDLGFNSLRSILIGADLNRVAAPMKLGLIIALLAQAVNDGAPALVPDDDSGDRRTDGDGKGPGHGNGGFRHRRLYRTFDRRLRRRFTGNGSLAVSRRVEKRQRENDCGCISAHGSRRLLGAARRMSKFNKARFTEVTDTLYRRRGLRSRHRAGKSYCRGMLLAHRQPIPELVLFAGA